MHACGGGGSRAEAGAGLRTPGRGRPDTLPWPMNAHSWLSGAKATGVGRACSKAAASTGGSDGHQHGPTAHDQAMSQLVTQGRKSRGWWQTPEDKARGHGKAESRTPAGGAAGCPAAVLDTQKRSGKRSGKRRLTRRPALTAQGRKPPSTGPAMGPVTSPAPTAAPWPRLTLNGGLMQDRSAQSGEEPEREKAGDEAWAGELPETRHGPKGQNRAGGTASPALGKASAPRLAGTRAATAWDGPPLLHKAPG